MKKIIPLYLLACMFLNASSQVVLRSQLPVSGLTLKSQLWNLSVINTTNQDVQGKIQVLLTDVSNNQKVLSGTTRLIHFPKGLYQVMPSNATPIFYNVLSPGYNLNSSQEGLLPVGSYSICYNLQVFAGDGTEVIAEECEVVPVESLSPPMLVSPSDSDKVGVRYPVFTWLPPAPVIMYTSLNYDLKVVEVLGLQSGPDALQQNMPLHLGKNIMSTVMPYPSSLSGLDTGKLYAWQVTAKSGRNAVAQSEVWTFRIKSERQNSEQEQPDGSYARLKREIDASYVICNGILKYLYTDELNDKEGVVNLYDITTARRRQVTLEVSQTSLKYGQNFLELDLTGANDLTDRHMYLLELVNSRQEHWYLKFEYRRN